MILFNETKSIEIKKENLIQKQSGNADVVQESTSTSNMKLFFEKESNIIRKEIQKLTYEEIAQKFKIKNNTLNKTYNYYQKEEEKTVSAIYGYSGIAYQMLEVLNAPLEPNNLKIFKNSDIKKYLEEKVFIMSSMYGILNAIHQIKPYRLDFTIKVVENQNLYDYWEKLINDFIINSNEKSILLLASQEYLKLLNEKLLISKGIKLISLVSSPQNKMKLNSMDFKKIRGIILNYCIEKNIKDYSELDKFEYEDIFHINYVTNANSDVDFLEITKFSHFPLKNKK